MVRRLASLVVLAVAILPGIEAADGDQAMDFFRAGRLVEAASEFQAIVDEKPDDHHAWFMLGFCMLRANRPVDAEPMFRRALALDRSKPEYFHGLALSLRARGRHAEAIAVLGAGLETARDARSRFAMFSLRGSIEAALERWSSAIPDLELARTIKADPALLATLGRAYLASGREAQAVDVLEEALAINGEDGLTRRTLAESLLRLGGKSSDPVEKRTVYERALRHGEILAAQPSGDPDLRNIVGRAALGAGRLDIAERAFLDVLERAPGQCYAMVNLARVYVAGSRWTDVEAMLQRARACAPRLASVHETWGSALLRQARWAEAREAFLKAREIAPSPSAEVGLEEAEKRLRSEIQRVTSPTPSER